MRVIAPLALVASIACARVPSCEAQVALTGRQLRVCAEVADTDGERERGLMGRASLPADRGMLFVWPGEPPAARAFFMYRTRIPLDLVVIRAGVVVEVHRLEPCGADDRRDCPLTRTAPADAVLELEAGTAGAGPGARVEVRSP